MDTRRLDCLAGTGEFPPRDRGDDANVAVSYLGGIPRPSTRQSSESRLNALALHLMGAPGSGLLFPWELLREQHTKQIRAWLDHRVHSPVGSPDHVSIHSANAYLTTLRQVLKHAWERRLMPTEDYRAVVDVKGFNTDKSAQQGRALAAHEIENLTHECLREGGATGARDALILTLALDAGLKLREMSILLAEDFLRGGEFLKICQTNRAGSRVVQLNSGTTAAAHVWFRLRGDQPGSALNHIYRSGRISESGMTTQAIAARLTLRAKQAKTQGLSVRDTRTTYMFGLFAAGHDIRDIRMMAGYADLASTARYDRGYRRDAREPF